MRHGQSILGAAQVVGDQPDRAIMGHALRSAAAGLGGHADGIREIADRLHDVDRRPGYHVQAVVGDGPAHGVRGHGVAGVGVLQADGLATAELRRTVGIDRLLGVEGDELDRPAEAARIDGNAVKALLTQALAKACRMLDRLKLRHGLGRIDPGITDVEEEGLDGAVDGGVRGVRSESDAKAGGGAP